jgi:hypothetical protein
LCQIVHLSLAYVRKLLHPEQKADWERRYASYRKHYRSSSSARYYSTLRGFIIATLNAELKGE